MGCGLLSFCPQEYFILGGGEGGASWTREVSSVGWGCWQGEGPASPTPMQEEVEGGVGEEGGASSGNNNACSRQMPASVYSTDKPAPGLLVVSPPGSDQDLLSLKFQACFSGNIAEKWAWSLVWNG